MFCDKGVGGLIISVMRRLVDGAPEVAAMGGKLPSVNVRNGRMRAYCRRATAWRRIALRARDAGNAPLAIGPFYGGRGPPTIGRARSTYRARTGFPLRTCEGSGPLNRA